MEEHGEKKKKTNEKDKVCLRCYIYDLI